MTLRLGTRGSALALAQSQQVALTIESVLGEPVELVAISTLGDVHPGSLAAMPQPGVFVNALREALLREEVDVVVHSMKDLPSVQPADLVIAAVPQRVDPRDVLVSARGGGLADLLAGARVGTGSPRRQARLRAFRPDLEVVDLRGNVDSRIRRVRDGELDAVVLAAAGIERLGRADEISERIDLDIMLPAPAQGALAVECLSDNDLAWQLASLDHLSTRLATVAERQVLTTINATCATAVSAYAQVQGTRINLRAEVSGLQGEFAHATDAIDLGAGSTPIESAMGLGASVGQALLDAGALAFVNPR